MKQFLAKLLLILVWLGAIWLRVNQLNLSPPGLYADETSIGYNTYSVLKTGKDEYGISWPLFFRAFGEYKNPIFIYSLVPLVYLHGLTPETVRLGATMWGSLGVIVLSLIAWQISQNWTWIILSTTILALMPWQLHYSRLGFEAITLPTLMLVALWWFIKWQKTKKLKYAIGFGLSLGLSFYSYTTARMWAPLLLLLLVMLFKNHWLKNWRTTIVVLIIMAILLLPVADWTRQYPGSLTARMNQIAIWADKPKLIELGKRFLITYGGHLSPKFLFGKGDTTLRHSSGVSSELLTSWSLFLVIGLVLAIKKAKTEPFWRLIIIMLALFPLAASLTQTSPIATRTIQATPFFAMVIGLGMWWSLKKLRKTRWLQILFIAIWGLLIGLEFNHYYQDLLYQYPQRVGMPWHGFDTSLGPAISWTYVKSLAENQQLYLSDKIEQVYIQGLFFTQADPQLWQEKRQALFQVAQFKLKKKGQIWLVTAADCHDNQEVKILKTFGRDNMGDDYCAIQ